MLAARLPPPPPHVLRAIRALFALHSHSIRARFAPYSRTIRYAMCDTHTRFPCLQEARRREVAEAEVTSPFCFPTHPLYHILSSRPLWS